MGKFLGWVMIGLVVLALAIIGYFSAPPENRPQTADDQHPVANDRQYFGLGDDRGLRDPLPTPTRPPTAPKPQPAPRPPATAEPAYHEVATWVCPWGTMTQTAYDRDLWGDQLVQACHSGTERVYRTLVWICPNGVFDQTPGDNEMVWGKTKPNGCRSGE